MTRYTIEARYTDHIHCSVTLDSGETFGQNVYGEAAKTLAGIDSAIAEAVTRMVGQKVSAPVPADTAAIDSAIQAKSQLMLTTELSADVVTEIAAGNLTTQ